MSAVLTLVPYSRTGRARARQVRLGACCASCARGAHLAGLGAVPAGAADWQVSSGALKREVRRARSSGARLGALGLNAGESGAVSYGMTGAKAGSLILPGIGTAVGAVVGVIAGYILGAKHYFNVGNSNAVCQQLEQAWQQYTGIQGHVAGRALGVPTMVALFHAAVGAGLFPGNDMHLSFHEGTLACAGHGDWADAFLGQTLQGKAVNTCGAHNCMEDAIARYRQQPAPAGTPSAVYLVDSILLPMNQGAKIPWVYNGAQNPQVHQLLYDLADAYLAAQVGGTTPYVEYPAAQAGTPTAGAVGAPSASSSPAPSSSPAASSPAASSSPAPSSSAVVPYVSPAGSSAPSSPVVVPPNQTNALISSLLQQGQSAQAAYQAALQSLQANGVDTSQPAVQQQVAGSVQAMSAGGAGPLGNLSTPELWLIGGGVLGLVALVLVKGDRKK